MSDLTTEYEVLERAASCFTSARRNLMEGAAFLYQINSQNLWRGAYSSFGEYVQKHCQISESFAAKLVKVHEYYLVEGKVNPLVMNGTDMEKLYLAMRLEGTPSEQVEKAMTWSRKEIRDQLQDDKHPDCEHLDFEVFHRCKTCNRFHRV